MQNSVSTPLVDIGWTKAIIICSAPGRGALSIRRTPFSSVSERQAATSSVAKARWWLQHIRLQLLFQRTAFRHTDGGHDDKLRAWLVFLHLPHDVLGGVLFHLLSADGRVGAAYAGVEQSEVFINLCGRADGASWIARDDFLFDGDSGRDATNEVTLGFVHASQELAGIARQALHVASLTFGVECVEG